MNQKQFEQLVDKFQAKQRAILLSKGNDYAGEDKLSNFKNAGAAIKLTPAMSCLNLIATKVTRLGNLLNTPGKTPMNESVADSTLDLANYATLLAAILQDSENTNPINP